MATIRGQSALDGFDPNANGAIRVIVVQPDGKILIGGEFTTLAPNSGATVTRNHIARLNPDGTLDTAFDPNANSGVYAIALQNDGKIVVGGNFAGANSIGGQTRNHIARLDATTGAADSFDPNASLPVFAVAVQSNGKILVGGLFSGANSIGGQRRNFFARLDAETGAADSFDPNANSYVNSILVQRNGKIVVGGDFSGANSIGGQTRNRIARLDPATGLVDSFNPNANSTVLSLAQEADGKIIAGGDFFGPNSIGGQARNFIARLDPLSGAADSFDPNASSLVFAVAVQPDGKILAGGTFTTIGGQTRSYIARLDPATGAADSFDPHTSSTVLAIAVQQDNKVLAGGDFVSASPIAGAAVTRNHIARLEKDGRLDQTLNLGGDDYAAGPATSIAVQADGKILIGGHFVSVSGVPRSRIARLNSDGTLDPTFNPNASSLAFSIAVQPDGKVLVGGDFTSIGGQARRYIARLDPITGFADSFNPNANDGIRQIALQADGKIVVGGSFSGANSIGGQRRNLIARLDPATGLADSFDPNPDNFAVWQMAVQADGKILVGGLFSSIGGQMRHHIARLDPATGLADSFNPNPNSFIEAILAEADGKILVGGLFTGIGGEPRNYIARFNANTGLVDSFNPNSKSSVETIAVQADGKILVGGSFSGANSIGGQTRNHIARLDAVTGSADSFDPNPSSPIGGEVEAIGVQADGKILVSGYFSNIGGQPRATFARLSNDTAALQKLAASRTDIIWNRSGSSPKLERVRFEYSTDNVNYTFLGNGTPFAGSSWILTGLNLPTAQNIYIRARGSYRGGVWNCSESITESVRNVFFTASPLQLTTAVSRKTHGGAGERDIPLPLSGEPGVECRSTGGVHTLVVTFNNNIVSGNASLTTGTGTVAASSFSDNTMTVSLNGVADAQKITVTLTGVTDTSEQVLPDTPVSVNILIGDTNGDKTVNTSDVWETKLQSGQAITATNFREDANANGSINATDVSLVKSRSGKALP